MYTPDGAEEKIKNVNLVGLPQILLNTRVSTSHGALIRVMKLCILLYTISNRLNWFLKLWTVLKF